jgi:hypothetical protein
MGSKTIEARLHDSHFSKSDSNFNSMSILEDGNVYYTLSSHDIDTHGRVYRYNPETDSIDLFADLGEVTGYAGQKNLPHGKSHSPIFEIGDCIYIATHYGYYQGNDGKEEPAPPPEGYEPYPGGRIIEYNKVTKSFRVAAKAPPEEGILTMSADRLRGFLYCITWPRGYFLCYDINKRELVNIGQVSRGGEVGLGDNYFCLCRDIAVNPEDGAAYFTNADGEILMFNTNAGGVKSVEWAHMKKDIFGTWDYHRGGHQGYNWRHIKWNPRYGMFFGVHPKSGYLFSFDPKKRNMELIDRICSEHCRKSGEFEHFRYGYMTLTYMGNDYDTIYYISGFTRRDAKEGNLTSEVGGCISLVTYHLPSGKYTDHGIIMLEDGRYPTLTQSIAVHPNGRIYTCPWILDPEKRPDGKTKHFCDLISFKNPCV